MSDAMPPRNCIPIVARIYDAARDCYDPEVALPGLCLEETAPGNTSGTSEIACLVAPDGTRYAIAKGFTQCLTDSETKAGWVAKGDVGLCESGLSIVGPDGGPLTDTLCAETVARGYWNTLPFGPTNVDFATNADAGGEPRGNLVEQCSGAQ